MKPLRRGNELQPQFAKSKRRGSVVQKPNTTETSSAGVMTNDRFSPHLFVKPVFFDLAIQRAFADP